MNTTESRRIFHLLFLATLSASSVETLALPRLGRDAEGVVEKLDQNSKSFQLHRSEGAKPMTLVWNSRTRYIEGVQFVSAAKLHDGDPVKVIYRAPFFGKPFVTKVVLGEASSRRKNAQ